MDIRNYFKRPKLESTDEDPKCAIVPESSPEQTTIVAVDTSPGPSSSAIVTVQSSTMQFTTSELDLGFYVNKTGVKDDMKLKLLTDCYIPNKNYNFKQDADSTGCKRVFKAEWLDKYKWLAYSPHFKGALCKTCVLFKPLLKRGIMGAFIVSPFRKFKDMHECARNHESSQWHKESSVMAANFKSIKDRIQKDVAQQIDCSMARQVEENRKKLIPIISTIVFCGTHDLALRGKESQTGNFADLLKFRVQAGDRVLQEHLEFCSGNAKYTSVQVQNELIDICGQVIRKQIVDEINTSHGFSVLADETADISGKEQLSIGIRYVDTNHNIKEEFLGFQKLEKLDAETISCAILNALAYFRLEMDKLVGLGFDGCATMAGKESGVQQRIKMKYPKANFFHCASHRLNLVINDLCAVREIQNCSSSIKEIIKFFRESVLRRRLVANLPLLCETRWSAKYKAIRIFYENFVKIMNALENLATSQELNAATRSKAHQLHLTASQSNFIVAMIIIAKYSSKLEPVVNALQGVNINLLDVKNHIGIIEVALKKHRSQHETHFAIIFQEAIEIGNKIGVELEMKMSRIVQRQKHRSNPDSNSPEEYFRKVLYVPYLDSIISSLTKRFEDNNTPGFALSLLHPKFLTTVQQSDLMTELRSAEKFYSIENLCEEADTWLQYWQGKSIPTDMTLHDALKETAFFPAVAKGIIIFMTLPPTTCTVERSFSTLRRVKTWLRSTMSEERLSGLCMLSVHREKLKDNDHFCQSVLDIFSQTPRKLMFAFSDK